MKTEYLTWCVLVQICVHERQSRSCVTYIWACHCLLQRGCSETSCLTFAPCILSSVLTKTLPLFVVITPLIIADHVLCSFVRSFLFVTFLLFRLFLSQFRLPLSSFGSSRLSAFYFFLSFHSQFLLPRDCDRQVSSLWLLMCYSITFMFRVHFGIP